MGAPIGPVTTDIYKTRERLMYYHDIYPRGGLFVLSARIASIRGGRGEARCGAA